jgi:hypothetical protein
MTTRTSKSFTRPSRFYTRKDTFNNFSNDTTRSTSKKHLHRIGGNRKTRPDLPYPTGRLVYSSERYPKTRNNSDYKQPTTPYPRTSRTAKSAKDRIAKKWERKKHVRFQKGN